MGQVITDEFTPLLEQLQLQGHPSCSMLGWSGSQFFYTHPCLSFPSIKVGYDPHQVPNGLLGVPRSSSTSRGTSLCAVGQAGPRVSGCSVPALATGHGSSSLSDIVITAPFVLKESH